MLKYININVAEKHSQIILINLFTNFVASLCYLVRGSIFPTFLNYQA